MTVKGIKGINDVVIDTDKKILRDHVGDYQYETRVEVIGIGVMGESDGGVLIAVKQQRTGNLMATISLPVEIAPDFCELVLREAFDTYENNANVSHTERWAYYVVAKAVNRKGETIDVVIGHDTGPHHTVTDWIEDWGARGYGAEGSSGIAFDLEKAEGYLKMPPRSCYEFTVTPGTQRIKKITKKVLTVSQVEYI